MVLVITKSKCNSYVTKNLNKVDWHALSKNPNAIHILEKNLTEIDWWLLSRNPNAIHMLEKNHDKIYWPCLSSNPNAIHILENNISNICWYWLSTNPSIFQIDYDAMRETNKMMSEEIAKIVWHPSRMSRWPEDHLIDDSDEDSIQNISITSTIRTIKNSIKLRSL